MNGSESDKQENRWVRITGGATTLQLWTVLKLKTSHNLWCDTSENDRVIFNMNQTGRGSVLQLQHILVWRGAEDRMLQFPCESSFLDDESVCTLR